MTAEIQVRNPLLYKALVAKFGVSGVNVLDPGQKLNDRPSRDLLTGRLGREILDSGERFAVNCPFCNDQKGRLYINHAWLQWDERLCRVNDELVRCWNEGCMGDPDNRQRLVEMLFHGAQAPVMALDESVSVPAKEFIPKPPGRITPIYKIPHSPAYHYLAVRGQVGGYTVEDLWKWWQVGFCEKANDDPDTDRRCTYRIYIPLLADGQLAGYQCRYVGNREWTAACPKYVTPGGFKKSRYLYGLDNARQGRILVITEGPSSAWAVGPHAVALWGKTISPRQVELVKLYFDDPEKLVVVLLDGAAYSEAQIVASKLLASGLCAPVVVARLGFNDDPGSVGHAASWSAIDASCLQVDLDIRACLP